MKTLTVNIPGREYDILIEKGLLDGAGELISRIYSGKKIVVVTDGNVAPLYSERVKLSLEKQGFTVDVITVPAGEGSKSLSQLEELYGELLKLGITRTDLIVALGGGVVGDLTGYAAASLLRGIPYVQIPTTLLAQVDSSVGGKVAVNLKEGKNLVGAFYQPKMVIIDTECLETLDKRVLTDGMAEVIKYGAIWDDNLFSLLEEIRDNEKLFENIEEIVYTCCDIKRQVVTEDEFDRGGRMVLNFGHTIGHAIEKHYNYETCTHGEAVAVGMFLICLYGEKIGITEAGCAERIRSLLRLYNLPISVGIDDNSIYQAIAVDKKGEGDKINLILLEKIGKAVIKKFDKGELKYIGS